MIPCSSLSTLSIAETQTAWVWNLMIIHLGGSVGWSTFWVQSQQCVHLETYLNSPQPEHKTRIDLILKHTVDSPYTIFPCHKGNSLKRPGTAKSQQQAAEPALHWLWTAMQKTGGAIQHESNKKGKSLERAPTTVLWTLTFWPPNGDTDQSNAEQGSSLHSDFLKGHNYQQNWWQHLCRDFCHCVLGKH